MAYIILPDISTPDKDLIQMEVCIPVRNLFGTMGSKLTANHQGIELGFRIKNTGYRIILDTI